MAGGTAVIGRSQHHVGKKLLARPFGKIVDAQAKRIAENRMCAQPAHPCGEIDALRNASVAAVIRFALSAGRGKQHQSRALEFVADREARAAIDRIPLFIQTGDDIADHVRRVVNFAMRMHDPRTVGLIGDDEIFAAALQTETLGFVAGVRMVLRMVRSFMCASEQLGPLATLFSKLPR